MRGLIDEMHPEYARQRAQKDAAEREQQAVANAIQRVKDQGGSDRKAVRAGARALLAEKRRTEKRLG